MREQLRKEIVRRTGELVQSAQAAAVYEEESKKIAAGYDKLVAQGMTELEAYRAMLADIETMRAALAVVTAAEEAEAEAARNEEQAGKQRKKNFRKLAGSMQAVLWLLTVIWYFLYSAVSGNWHLSWLTFLGSAAGSTLIDILVRHHDGKPLKECAGWHGVFWIALTMAYFVVSFQWGGIAWAFTWLLFPAGAAVEVLWKALK